MPRLTSKTIELRKTVVVSIAQLIEQGKATSEKQALEFVLHQSKSVGINLGYSDNLDRAYNSYCMQKKRFHRHKSHSK